MRRAALLALLATPLLSLGQGADPSGGDLAPAAPPPGEAPPAPQPPPPPAPDTSAPPVATPEPAPPAPPAPAPAPAPQPAPPQGQWVYTSQYGWLFIPWAQQYTYVSPDPAVYPDQYVYYPAYGWRWVVAPWVYGYGPAPYWGSPGPARFAWYVRPWFRVGGRWGWGGYRSWGSYRGWVGPRSWGSRGWERAPAYYRSGASPPHPHPAAPAPRVERGHRGGGREQRGAGRHEGREREGRER